MDKKGERRVKEVLLKNLINIKKYIFFLYFTRIPSRYTNAPVYARTRVVGVKEERRSKIKRYSPAEKGGRRRGNKSGLKQSCFSVVLLSKTK